MSGPPNLRRSSAALRRRALLVAVLTTGVLGPTLPARAATTNVAAASDLAFALEDVVRVFKEETGEVVTLAFGSSGNFTRQILQGAPFELFLSADEAFVDELAERGRTVDGGALYAIGRVVLFAPHGSPLQVDAVLDGLRAAAAAGTVRRFAIANPEHAPYGRAAEQVLRSQGLWELLRPRLVLGENVSQAAQFATTGAAQGGIFAYSLALAPAVAERGSYVLLPEAWHAPLRQRMVLLRGATATAGRFYAYLQTPAARAVLERYGFALPGEAG